jgi:hypothetical protein
MSHLKKGLALEDGKDPLPSEGNDRDPPHGTTCKGFEELSAPPLRLENIKLELHLSFW